MKPAPGKHTTNVLRAAAGVCAAGLLLGACGGDGGGGGGSGVGTAEPRQGGTLTFLASSEPGSLAPFNAANNSVGDGNRMSAIYDALVWSDPATGVVQPQMAESLTADGAGTIWRLTLRPGIRFTDGTPLNADAVKATWETHLVEEWHSLQALTVSGMELVKTDDLTLTVKLKKPNANFDRIVASQLNFITSPDALKNSTPEDLAKNPVGAGPFKTTESVPGEPMTLVRNPDYWQAGKPYLDKLVFKADGDLTAGAEAVRKGRADATVTVDAGAIGRAQGTGVRMERLRLDGGLMIAFNNRRAPFNDVRFRQAVVMALSSTEVNDRFFGGKGTPARGIFSADSPLANSRLAPAENRPDEARALFDKLAAEGRKMDFTYLAAQDPSTRQIADYLREKLQPYGVTVRPDIVDMVELVARQGTYDFDAALSGLWVDDPEPTVYQFLHSEDPWNLTGYTNSRKIVDTQLDKARRATDQDTRREAYTQVQQEINREVPFWVFQEAAAAVLTNSKVTGVQVYSDGLLLWDRIGLRK